MPDAKFMKPWHGIAREAIDWHPTVREDVCIGCGTCVTGCSRLVYRFDYDQMKAVVFDPLDAYVAVPRVAITTSAAALHRRGVALDRVFVDPFGLQSVDLA